MWSRGGKPIASALFACVTCALTAGAGGAHPDVSTIIARSMTATQADWNAAPQYDFFERDNDGGTVKTYHVRMIQGSPYDELVAVDDRPLAPAARARERQKLQDTIARRRAETPAARARRIRSYDQSRARDHALTEQLTRAFDFTWAGQQRVGSRDAYVLQATPRPDYVPPDLESRALTGMQGTLWIDSRTFQWLKVTAEVRRPVSIAGFLARVEPGTFFSVEYMPVGGGIWQPKRFTMRSKSLIMFFFPHRTQEDDTFFDYTRTPGAGGQ